MYKPKKSVNTTSTYTYLEPINNVQKGIVKVSETPNPGESLLIVTITTNNE